MELEKLYQKEKSKIDEQIRQNESPLGNTSNNNSENLELDPDKDDEARSVEPNYLHKYFFCSLPCVTKCQLFIGPFLIKESHYFDLVGIGTIY